jgi:adenylate cyclase
MEEDSDGTVAAWQDAREDIIKPSVADHSGNIVKLTGDGFLVEFPTVQDAVNCAIAMQQELTSSSLEFRIGINLGDIIDDGEDIHGEGVNVAARLEGLAEPGSIVVSGDVYNQVKNRIEAVYEDMGPQEVKNVTDPVQAYGVNIEAVSGSKGVSVAATDKPSIAVLPFDNLSGDPDQEYFTDGITEDVITALSRVRWLAVIARNTMFTYKDKAVDVQAVAEDLNVRYILEGSVRKAGDTVRVSAQLIDGPTRNHVWAERYDRDLKDVFEVQDDLTHNIVAALPIQVEAADLARTRQKRTVDMSAYENVLRGINLYYRETKEDNADAIAFFSQAIAADSNYARAYCQRRSKNPPLAGVKVHHHGGVIPVHLI